MLQNQVIYKNGAFILALSPEEAKDLGIPDELYAQFVDYVKQLNKK